jgi:hypothetical protein
MEECWFAPILALWYEKRILDTATPWEDSTLQDCITAHLAQGCGCCAELWESQRQVLAHRTAAVGS